MIILTFKVPSCFLGRTEQQMACALVNFAHYSFANVNLTFSQHQAVQYPHKLHYSFVIPFFYCICNFIKITASAIKISYLPFPNYTAYLVLCDITFPSMITLFFPTTGNKILYLCNTRFMELRFQVLQHSNSADREKNVQTINKTCLFKFNLINYSKKIPLMIRFNYTYELSHSSMTLPLLARTSFFIQ